MNFILAKRHGFSIIELLVVIAIVGILAAIAMPTYKMYQARSRMMAAAAVMSNIADQAIKYAALNGKYPTGPQLGLPASPVGLVPYASAAFGWGNYNAWGDSCGKSAYVALYLDSAALGIGSVSDYAGMGISFYNINGATRKVVAYFEHGLSGNWIYGDNLLPGAINQYEDNSSAAYDALSASLLAAASCSK